MPCYSRLTSIASYELPDECEHLWFSHSWCNFFFIERKECYYLHHFRPIITSLLALEAINIWKELWQAPFGWADVCCSNIWEEKKGKKQEDSQGATFVLKYWQVNNSRGKITTIFCIVYWWIEQYCLSVAIIILSKDFSKLIAYLNLCFKWLKELFLTV